MHVMQDNSHDMKRDGMEFAAVRIPRCRHFAGICAQRYITSDENKDFEGVQFRMLGAAKGMSDFPFVSHNDLLENQHPLPV